MTLIAAVDRAWGIGRGGALLFRIPADMRRFKALTMGHALLMGRKTFESLPKLTDGQLALPGRAHGVLSQNPGFAPSGVTVLRAKGEALAWAQGMRAQDRELFLIGGALIYEALLDECDTAYITKFDVLGGADTFMSNLDSLPQWRLTQAGPWQEDAGLRFRFCTYARVP